MTVIQRSRQPFKVAPGRGKGGGPQDGGLTSTDPITGEFQEAVDHSGATKLEPKVGESYSPGSLASEISFPEGSKGSQ